MDDIKLRQIIDERKERLPQKLLAKWALNLAMPMLAYLDEYLKDDPRIALGIESLEERIEGKISAHDLRQTGFIVNQFAKESETDKSKYAARAFAQAIATGHMRGHAMVSSDYAVKTVNTITNKSIDAASEERTRQLKLLNKLLDENN